MRQAVIDVGTNSTRLYVADTHGRAQSKVAKELAVTRLGEGINSSDVMGDKPLERTTDAIRDFVCRAREFGAERIYVYATAVVREASNKEDFLRLVKEKTGIIPEILSGELEAKIAYLGASGGADGCAVIDIGGGSTEVISAGGAVSEKVGAVRLKEMFYETHPDITKVKEYVAEKYIPAYSGVMENCKELIGVSGTATTFASLCMGSNKYVPEKIQDAVLEKRELDRQISLLAEMDTGEREKYCGDFSSRADIIVYGGCLLSAFLAYYGFEKMTVSDRDSLEGFLMYKA